MIDKDTGVLTQELQTLLSDNGFSSLKELAIYKTYNPALRGCNLEDRFYVFEEGFNYVHCEYVLLEAIMEVAYGTAGKEWRLMRQRLIEGEEPSLDGKVMCPFCADEMIVQAPNGEEESFYFDVTAHMLSFENSSSGEEGFKE